MESCESLNYFDAEFFYLKQMHLFFGAYRASSHDMVDIRGKAQNTLSRAIRMRCMDFNFAISMQIDLYQDDYSR
jgi:hypothetical protein